MPNYRRPDAPGSTWFITIVTHDRRGFMLDEPARNALRHAVADTRRRRPFHLIAIVLLPNHLHLMMELPTGDADASTRVAGIKAGFTRRYLTAGGREAPISDDRRRHRHRGVWQQRFHDHVIRDQPDYEAHLNYLVYNPVRHGLCRCPHDWPHSSFHTLVRDGIYDAEWSCHCGDASPFVPPVPTDLRGLD
jgi:putative transposase